jgi:hypothetical protein
VALQIDSSTPFGARRRNPRVALSFNTDPEDENAYAEKYRAGLTRF